MNTSTGSVNIEEGSVVSNNYADGIKYNFHRKPPEKSAGNSILDFCQGSSNPKQVYPLVIQASQQKYAYKDANCERVSNL